MADSHKPDATPGAGSSQTPEVRKRLSEEQIQKLAQKIQKKAERKRKVEAARMRRYRKKKRKDPEYKKKQSERNRLYHILNKHSVQARRVLRQRMSEPMTDECRKELEELMEVARKKDEENKEKFLFGGESLPEPRSYNRRPATDKEENKEKKQRKPPMTVQERNKNYKKRKRIAAREAEKAAKAAQATIQLVPEENTPLSQDSKVFSESCPFFRRSLTCVLASESQDQLRCDEVQSESGGRSVVFTENQQCAEATVHFTRDKVPSTPKGNSFFYSVIMAKRMNTGLIHLRRELSQSSHLENCVNPDEAREILSSDEKPANSDVLYIFSCHYRVNICVHWQKDHKALYYQIRHNQDSNFVHLNLKDDQFEPYVR